MAGQGPTVSSLGYMDYHLGIDPRRQQDKTFHCVPPRSICILRLLLLPVLYPLCDPSAVGLDIIILLAIQFHHDLFVECLARFFEQNPEDLRVEILL